MPHVIVKLYPGRSEAQKCDLAERITAALTGALGSTEASISIAIEEVPAEAWVGQVFDPEIRPNLDSLYKKPGYQP